MAKRGLMIGNEFRYLEQNYRGTARLEMMPHDNEFGSDRWGAYLLHNQTWGPWSLYANLQRVSDDNYFRDLSSRIETTSRILLPREALATRAGALGSNGQWILSAFVQRWQTLQDPRAPITPPYNRWPQVLLDTVNYDVYNTDVAFTGGYTYFQHPSLLNGQRIYGYPSIALP